MEPSAILYALWAVVVTILLPYLAFYVVLWLLFVFCMGLDRQLHAPAITAPDGTVLVAAGLPKPALAVGMVWLGIGHALNFIGNVGLTFAFLELPREVGITLRVTRWIERMDHKHAPRRKAFALWLRVTWMDGHDRKGIHRAE